MRGERILRLTDARGGAPANLPGPATTSNRWCVTTASRDPDFGFIGSDPFNTEDFTGIVVPSAPSASIAGARYLMLLARAQFNDGQQGVKLVGIRQFADLVARIPGVEGSPDTVFHREILSPLFHLPDGNISWHVMIIDKTWRDRRNPANVDSLIYQDAYSPAILYQSLAPYVPPNGGRPWGTPIDSSLGNIHELRYPWRTDSIETELRIPVPVPSDVALFASVRQNDPALNPSASELGLTSDQVQALELEDQFVLEFSGVQFGHVAGSLVFEGDSL